MAWPLGVSPPPSSNKHTPLFFLSLTQPHSLSLSSSSVSFLFCSSISSSQAPRPAQGIGKWSEPVGRPWGSLGHNLFPYFLVFFSIFASFGFIFCSYFDFFLSKLCRCGEASQQRLSTVCVQSLLLYVLDRVHTMRGNRPLYLHSPGSS